MAARAHRRAIGKASRRERILPQAVSCNDCDPIEQAASPTTTEQQSEERELRRAVQAEVQALPEKLRIPVLLHYTSGLGVADIAAALGLPQGTVKSRLYQARRRIKAGLEAKGYEEDVSR